MDEERKGLPSASSMERYASCDASLPLERLLRGRAELPPNEDSPEAAHGRLIHNIAHKMMNPGDPVGAGFTRLEIEEAKTYVKVAKEIAMRAWGSDEEGKIICEQRMFLTDLTGKQIATGQADVVWLHDEEALVIDYKTGWLPLSIAGESWQLRLYAAMVRQRFGVKQARICYIHQGKFHSEEILGAEDLDTLVELIFPGLLLDRHANPFFSSYAPGDDVCRYCPCKLKCPALNAQYMLMEPKAEDMDETFMPAQSNCQLERLKGVMDSLIPFSKALDSEMLNRGGEDEFAFDLFVVAPGRGRRVVPNAGDLCEAMLSAGAEMEDIYGAVKIGVGDAEKIHRKFSKLKGEIAKADFANKFGDHVEFQEGKPTLQKRKLALRKF